MLAKFFLVLLIHFNKIASSVLFLLSLYSTELQTAADISEKKLVVVLVRSD